MARKSTQKLKSDVGESRDAKIAAMVATGLTNDQVFAALAADDPTIWDEKDPRRTKASPAFDKTKRQRTLEAIRSVRFKVTGDEETIERNIKWNGDGEVKPISSVDYRNVHRFSTGIKSIDNIYGQSEFVYLDGAKRGQLTGEIQIGLPEAFVSIWAGSPGVGKSRLAISVTKSLNKLGHKVLYFNGEAEESQFRMWCGMDVDPKLFLVRSTQALRLETVVADVLTHKPKVVIVDSLQMIQALGGMMAIISRLQLLKNDPDAGRPHFILISQLNKKGELKGSRDLEHMVDFVANVTRIEGRQGQFRVECPRKNRGGPTPRWATFRHENGTVVTVTFDHAPDNLNLIQPAMVPVNNEPEAVVRPFVPNRGPAPQEQPQPRRRRQLAGTNIAAEDADDVEPTDDDA